jgi:hypothetical protein
VNQALYRPSKTSFSESLSRREVGVPTRKDISRDCGFRKGFADSLPLLGGTCNEKLAAKTWDGMVKAMTKNVVEKAPGCRKGDGGNARRGFVEIGREMKPKWEAGPQA